ncbi:MAG TPA: sigma factor-like helix-turn-helix DNA-binding protein [Solirubrobacteraceae bacterium]|nr:sigma factor-like helix-turn-helix DNA-binding protein [Solirubrobacteraceae bacterium]
MHITELGLSPAAHACLEAAAIAEVEQLTAHPAGDLLDTGHFGRVELHEIINALNDSDLTLPPVPRGRLRPPRPRERQMLRLRLIERKTLAEIGQQTGVSKERVRQLLNQHFGLTGRR